MSARSAIDPGTLQAYRETEYRVCGAAPLVLRIGVMCADLVLLHEQYHTDCSAFITACNPLGDLLEPAMNTERQEALAEEMARRGFKALCGEGVHPTGRWPPEPSFLILGLKREAARELGCQFQQNAIVWSGADAVPELVLLR